LALEVGIDVPLVWQARSLVELSKQRDDIRFPVVLKWPDPHAVSGWLHARGLPVDKFRYCLDWPDLELYLAQFEGLGSLPMVQEYCPGHGLGQSFFMHNGEALVAFQHRRLHEWPPEGGSSSLCVSLAADVFPDLQHRSVELLRRIGWQGPAMVEYRHDPASGRTCLMEINGRFWGSLPLASQAGIEFGWLTYSVLGLGQEPRGMVAKGGLRCCFLVPEAKRLWRILRQPALIQDPTLKFSPVREALGLVATVISPWTKYFLFSWSDPLPAIADITHAFGKRLHWKGDQRHSE
jgi:predicted ATP-grasp superfamily ATP-dependent carboligase